MYRGGGHPERRVDQPTVLESIASIEIGDSIASVVAPSNDGGNMIKVHIHTNDPEAVFEQLRAFSRDPVLKKEKVEDMHIIAARLERGKVYHHGSRANCTSTT